MPATARPYYLPIIVLAQFAGNAVIDELQQEAGKGTIASVTSLVKFGFISRPPGVCLALPGVYVQVHCIFWNRPASYPPI